MDKGPVVEMSQARTRDCKVSGAGTGTGRGSVVCNKDAGVGRAWGQATKARIKGVVFILSAVENNWEGLGSYGARMT